MNTSVDYREIDQALADYMEGSAHSDLRAKIVSYGTQSLPASLYSTDGILRYEVKKIFLQSWQLIGHISDLRGSGDYLTLDIMDHSYFALRGDDNQIRAFENVCPHKGSRLLSGDRGSAKKRIMCPYHRWIFALDGSLNAIPDDKEHFDSLDREGLGLKQYEVDIFHGLIFINLGSKGRKPSEIMALLNGFLSHYRIAEMTAVETVEKVPYQANWKLICENDRDAHHIPGIHPELMGLFGYRNFPELVAPDGVWHSMMSIRPRSARAWTINNYLNALPIVAHLPETLRRAWANFNIYPNFSFCLHPEFLDIMQILPVSYNESQVRCYIYGLEDDSPAMRRSRYLAARINDATFAQDKAMLESVQPAYSSEQYRSGPLSIGQVGVLDFVRLTSIALADGPLDVKSVA